MLVFLEIMRENTILKMKTILISLILIVSMNISSSVYVTPTEEYSQIELGDTIGITLFWHVNFDVNAVKLSVQFQSKNTGQDSLSWLAIGFSDFGELSLADLCFMWYDKQGKEHFQVIIMRIQDILITF